MSMDARNRVVLMDEAAMAACDFGSDGPPIDTSFAEIEEFGHEVGTTRTEEDLVQHIHGTIQTDPLAGWVFVMDNLNVHCSESLVRYVARLEDLDESTLGVKGKSGILQSMATRQAFLIYHVMSRGNARQRIFRDDEDRAKLLGYLEDSVVRCGWELFSFVLMPNHFHPFFRTPRPNLSRGKYQERVIFRP